MTVPEKIQAAVDALEAYVAIHHTVAHGGVGATVVTENGVIPSLAKKLSDLGAQIVTGFEAGFVVVVANDAGRTAAQPGQVGQPLWQLDTETLYIGTATTSGAWSVHPLQASINEPVEAVAELTEVVDVIDAWRLALDPTNSGVVGSANALAPVVAAAAPPADYITIYGKKNTGGASVQTIPIPRYLERFSSLLVPATSFPLLNTSRDSLSSGFVGGITSSGRLLVWGNQTVAGTFGRGTAAIGAHIIQSSVVRNNAVRPIPTFNPIARKVVKVINMVNSTHLLLDDGTICAAGPATAGVWDCYGSNSGTAQNVFQACYFNASGANKAMVQFDMASPSYNAYAYSSFISIDGDGAVWIMTNNPATSISYSNGLTGAQKIPLNVSPAVAGWSGKTATKVRCTGFGGMFVLLSDKTLWAASSFNGSGFLGLGGTTTLSNFTQIQTGVDDFELSGDYDSSYYALYVLQGSTLKGAGYNGAGQLVTGNTTNQTSFVTMATNVAKMRVGGDNSNVSVLIQKLDGTMHGVGFNTPGNLGNGANTSLSSLTSLTVLDALVAANGASVTDFSITGWGTTNSSALITSNGKGFAAGSNALGQLGIGTFADSNLWQEVSWAPVDSTEKLVAVQPFIVNSTGHFAWLTSFGRILVAGYDTNNGITSGIPGTMNTNRSSLSEIRL